MKMNLIGLSRRKRTILEFQKRLKSRSLFETWGSKMKKSINIQSTSGISFTYFCFHEKKNFSCRFLFPSTHAGAFPSFLFPFDVWRKINKPRIICVDPLHLLSPDFRQKARNPGKTLRYRYSKLFLSSNPAVTSFPSMEIRISWVWNFVNQKSHRFIFKNVFCAPSMKSKKRSLEKKSMKVWLKFVKVRFLQVFGMDWLFVFWTTRVIFFDFWDFENCLFIFIQPSIFESTFKTKIVTSYPDSAIPSTLTASTALCLIKSTQQISEC